MTPQDFCLCLIPNKIYRKGKVKCVNCWKQVNPEELQY